MCTTGEYRVGQLLERLRGRGRRALCQRGGRAANGVGPCLVHGLDRGHEGPLGLRSKGIGAIISVHAEESSANFGLFGSPGEVFS